jgi:hypothetical protein
MLKGARSIDDGKAGKKGRQNMTVEFVLVNREMAAIPD